jgi:hypothetical protein
MARVAEARLPRRSTSQFHSPSGWPRAHWTIWSYTGMSFGRFRASSLLVMTQPFQSLDRTLPRCDGDGVLAGRAATDA